MRDFSACAEFVEEFSDVNVYVNVNVNVNGLGLGVLWLAHLLDSAPGEGTTLLSLTYVVVFVNRSVRMISSFGQTERSGAKNTTFSEKMRFTWYLLDFLLLLRNSVNASAMSLPSWSVLRG